MTTVLELLGFVLIVAGCYLLAPAAALIPAGAGLMVLAYALEVSRDDLEPPAQP